MMREKTSDPWREVSWDEAIGRVASEFKRLQTTYGTGSIGVTGTFAGFPVRYNP